MSDVSDSNSTTSETPNRKMPRIRLQTLYHNYTCAITSSSVYALIVLWYHASPLDRGGEQNLVALLMVIPHVPYLFLRGVLFGNWQPKSAYAEIIEMVLSYGLFGILLALTAHWICKGITRKTN